MTKNNTNIFIKNKKTKTTFKSVYFSMDPRVNQSREKRRGSRIFLWVPDCLSSSGINEHRGFLSLIMKPSSQYLSHQSSVSTCKDSHGICTNV